MHTATALFGRGRSRRPTAKAWCWPIWQVDTGTRRARVHPRQPIEQRCRPSATELWAPFHAAPLAESTARSHAAIWFQLVKMRLASFEPCVTAQYSPRIVRDLTRRRTGPTVCSATEPRQLPAIGSNIVTQDVKITLRVLHLQVPM